MNLSNWIYLGVGLGLGVSTHLLLRRTQQQSPSSSAQVQQNQPDVSTLLQQLKQTQLAYQLAQEASKFKAGFLARTSHELRSPLNGIIGLQQLILSDLCENADEEREFIAQSYERSQKLVKLIDEILAVARTEHGTNQLDIYPLSLDDILQQVYQLTYLLAANRNYPFHLSPVDADIYVLADQRWLRQILVHLVSAAIAKMEEGSILLFASVNKEMQQALIWLDVPLNFNAWSEPIDLITSENAPSQTLTENTPLSEGMSLLMNQTMLEIMQGKLEILTVPSDLHSAGDYTRLQISIPLTNPEAEFHSLAESQN